MAVGGLAGLLLGVNTNGYTYARLCAFPNISGSSATGNLGVWARPDGTVYTEAPEPEEGDGGTKIATTGWTQKNGGRSWGLGRSAIPMTSTEFSDGDVNKIDKCGFYGLSSAKNALWATSILLHIQRPWTAGPNAFQFNFGTDGEFAVRTFNDATTWSEWRKVAHQDWVLSQLSTSCEETHICQLDIGKKFTRAGSRICGSIQVQIYKSINGSATQSDDFGIYVGNNRVAVVTITWRFETTGGAGHGRSIEQTGIGSFEVSSSIPANSTITLRRESSNVSGEVRSAFASVTVSNS